MTELMRRCARLMVPRLELNDPDSAFDAGKELILGQGIRSLIVFGGKVRDAARVIGRLQTLCDEPLIVSADLERGAGQQFSGATVLPYFKGLGENFRSTGSTDLIRIAAEVTAREACACGVSVNFSPVVDIDNNPNNPIIGIRAFGETPEIVINCGDTYVDRLLHHRVLPVLKHFPGHGDTSVDSHEHLPELRSDIRRLEANELKPFMELIRKHPTTAVMAGHLAVRALDPGGKPASLSEMLIQGTLRRNWGFDGVVYTDALMMGAVDDDEAPVEAFKAGADQLLIPGNLETAIQRLSSVVERDRRWEQRLAESLGRIDRLHGQLKLPGPPVDLRNVDSVVSCVEHVRLAERLWKGVSHFMIGHEPVMEGKTLLLKLEAESGSLHDASDYGFETRTSWIGDEPAPLPEYDTLIVLTDLRPAAWKQTAFLPLSWANFLNHALQKNHLIVSTGSDRLGHVLANLKNYYCTFGSVTEARSLIKRLSG